MDELVLIPVNNHHTPFNIRLEVEVSCVLVWDHTGWVKNKTHETSTFKRMINGVLLK